MLGSTNLKGCGAGRWFLAAVLGGWQLVGLAYGKEVSDPTTVERLVDQARQAEVEGDTARQFSLLREAVRVAPDDEVARWQLGQLKVGDAWVPVEESQRVAAANPKQAEYRQLRTQYGESTDGQLALARWCNKNDLDEEARFHWASALAAQPENEEALRALGMWMYEGQPMTPADIAQAKQQVREAKRAAEQWEPIVAKWRRAVFGNNATLRDAALHGIRTLSAAEAIPTLETVTLGREAAQKHTSQDCQRFSLAFMEALDGMSAQAASESLVRHAVLSPSAGVRSSAAEKLKKRPMHEYVPLLLGGLAMPIESSFSVTTDRYGCVHYRHSLYREGADTDMSVDASYNVMQHSFPGRDYVYRIQAKVLEDRTESPARRVAKMAAVARRSEFEYGRTAAAMESQVWSANQAAESLNARIMPALAAATGEDYGSPKQWWDWWQDNNEYYAYDHPVEHQYYSGTDDRYYGRPYDTVSINPSCFVKGTPVWTKTGQQPIETIVIGDLVLAQDLNTGELAHQPVIGRTVRPLSPIVKLSFGGEQILTTRGHPFWVAGVGWRMAKELEGGAVLHGVTGSTRITAVKESEPAEAYNLVVADFNTYFVGEGGILVHDNTPRRPTRATVPGLAGAK
jgi:hypothetical protein